MDVRLARPTDALLVLSLSLDEGAHLVRGPAWPSCNPVTRSVARTALPFAPLGRLWIARDSQGSGLLEAAPRRYVIGWDITRFAVHGNHEQIVPPLLAAAAEHLQSRRVPRLFARCSEDSADELRSAGFHSLAREFVLHGEGRPSPEDDTLPVDSRYRMPQDAWPLHQLESEVTPTLVRQMEGLTSLDWSRRRPKMREIVVERDGQMVAWVGWGARLGRGVAQIGLLVHPDHAALGMDLLRYALGQSPSGTHLVARVRDYQPEVLNAFLRSGFSQVADEVLMVKHAQVVPVQTLKPIMAVASVPGVRAFRHHVRVIAHPPTPPLTASGGVGEEKS